MRFTGGLPETACGKGSTLASTEYLRSRLTGMIVTLGGGVLIDAPCGDCNWIAKTVLPVTRYIGVDSSTEHLARARDNLIGWGVPYDLILVDLLSPTSMLPTADIVICRDFLQHVPNASLFVAIRSLLTSGADWIMITSHEGGSDDDVELGGFRPLDLTKAPLCLPPPTMEIADGSGRSLGVWSGAVLMEAVPWGRS